MRASVFSWIEDRLHFGDALKDIPPDRLDQLMRQSGAADWHKYAISKRKERRHACTACRWLNDALPKDAAIFEPGCGGGAICSGWGSKVSGGFTVPIFPPMPWNLG